MLPAATQAWTSHQSGVNPDFGETHPHPTSAPAARLYPPDVDGSVCRSGRLVPVLLLLPLRSPPTERSPALCQQSFWQRVADALEGGFREPPGQMGGH